MKSLVSSAGPSPILTWHRNEKRCLAIADLIWYSPGEQAGLPDVAFVVADKFSEIYITCTIYEKVACCCTDTAALVLRSKSSKSVLGHHPSSPMVRNPLIPMVHLNYPSTGTTQTLAALVKLDV